MVEPTPWKKYHELLGSHLQFRNRPVELELFRRGEVCEVCLTSTLTPSVQMSGQQRWVCMMMKTGHELRAMLS